MIIISKDSFLPLKSGVRISILVSGESFRISFIQFAKCSAAEYIRKIGKDRIMNVHFKDYTNPDEWNSLVPCGGGLVPFEEIIEACLEMGVENALVEQDTAPATGDSIGQMAKSAEYLLPLLK